MTFTNASDSITVPSTATDADPRVVISTDDPLMAAFATAGISWYYSLGHGFVAGVTGDGIATGIYRIVAGPANANFADRAEYLHAEYDDADPLLDSVTFGAGNRVNAPTRPEMRIWFDTPSGTPISILELIADAVRVDNPAEFFAGVTFDGPVKFNNTVDAPGNVYSVPYSGTTDASGFLTVTHGAPWTPVGGWFITTNPSGSFAQAWGIDNIGATTCRLRFTSTSATGALASTAVAGRLFLVR